VPSPKERGGATERRRQNMRDAQSETHCVSRSVLCGACLPVRRRWEDLKSQNLSDTLFFVLSETFLLHISA